jgi:hypothetical protein
MMKDVGRMRRLLPDDDGGDIDDKDDAAWRPL